MNNYRTRDDLKARLIEIFSTQEEVYAIYFFGKEVEGKADSYSDIDIIVCTNDPARTWGKYDSLLSHVSPIRERLLLNSQGNSFAEMVMLEDYRPYQKIDLSLVEAIQQETDFAPFLNTYQRPTKSERVLSVFPIKPRKRNLNHEINEILFSIPRFTKCLFRNDFDMYRRWKATTRNLLVLLYEKYFGWQEEVTRSDLRAQEAKQLYDALTPEDHHRLQAIYPPDAQINLAGSFGHSIEFYLDLAIQKARNLEVQINREFITYMKEFTRSEVEAFTQLLPPLWPDPSRKRSG
jgi:predicted nucleotidyltransferase